MENFQEYETIINSIYDEIFITDANGVVLFVNGACERLYNKKASELVGRNVKDLEKEGMFSPSITDRILKTKTSQTALQTTKTGRKILVTSIPILNEKNEVVKIVSNSRDLTELVFLRKQLEEKEQIVKQYTKTIQELSIHNDADKRLLYVSARMDKIRHLIDKVASSEINILLLGESGVGKTMLAEHIHGKSSRKDGPFQVINCSAIPETLLESELFGYEKGAYTGALREGKPGLFQLANGGTIFLDEIGEISPSLQTKLLQVIQERKFRKIGGLTELSANFRLITATNQNLQQRIKDKQYREDFFYRINGISIEIPPLRERKEDIGVLANHFLNEFNIKYGNTKKFSGEVLDILYHYNWPGNIRELKSVVERLNLVSEYDLIMINDLPEDFIPLINSREMIKDAHQRNFADSLIPLNLALEMVEEDLIRRAYEKFHNTYKVAEVLNISQATAFRKIKKYKIIQD